MQLFGGGAFFGKGLCLLIIFVELLVEFTLLSSFFVVSSPFYLLCLRFCIGKYLF
jgi:hypothetical protein